MLMYYSFFDKIRDELILDQGYLLTQQGKFYRPVSCKDSNMILLREHLKIMRPEFKKLQVLLK